MNDKAIAISPIPEYLLRKPMSGAHERMITIELGTSRSSFLEPVVTPISTIKLIIATVDRKNVKNIM